jgi:hypothetical protein
VLTNPNVCTIPGQNRSTIEKKMRSEAPLPRPRSVICSPSHITKSAPVVRNSTICRMKPEPGVGTAPGCNDGEEREAVRLHRVARATVK